MAGGRSLRCNAPEEVLTEALGQQLKARKAEIVEFLSRTPGFQSGIQAGFQAGFNPGAIAAAARPERLPLSFAQQRLWFLEQMQQEGAIYNIPLAIRVTGALDIELFRRCLNTIVQRHEALRTNFVMAEGQPYQVISAQRDVTIEQTDLRALSDTAQTEAVRERSIAAAQTQFDLGRDLLFQVVILRLGAQARVVLFTMHHIISDGWSMEQLLKELLQLYRAFWLGLDSPLPELPIQYADFALWQRQWLQGEVLKQQLNYWQRQLAGDLPILQLPTDFPRAKVQRFQGAIAPSAFPKPLLDSSKRWLKAPHPRYLSRFWRRSSCCFTATQGNETCWWESPRLTEIEQKSNL
ncbi:MAG: hypothetical protein HC771_16475 [Synechococcales cyanobacterium CRU_2_2]|nr:hypothetical protein [Synechococcales cyanobacterium CRU_2_2]